MLPPTITTELRAMLRLAAPLVAGQLLLFGANVIDTLLAGHLGPLVLGAVAIGGSVWILPLMTLQGVMFAVPTSVAHLVGAGRRAEVGALFRQALFMAAGLGVLVMIGLRLGAGPLVALLGLAPDVTGQAVAFLHAIAFGAPPLAVFMACRGLSDGLSLTRPAMWFGALGLMVLLPLGYALMYGVFGLPGLGAEGSGLATALQLWIGALCFAVYIARGRGYRGIGWAAGPRGPDLRAIGGLLALGVPMAATIVLEAGLFSFAAFAIGRFGAAAVSSHQIALNVAGLTFMVPLGLSGAITVRVGRAMGAGQPMAAQRAGMVGIGLALSVQAVAACVMLSVPHAIAALYSADPAVQAGTVSLLGLAGLFQLSDGMQVAANGALRGLKDARVPVAITLLAYWGLGMPIGLALAFPGGMAARGMWVGLLVGLTVAAVLLTWRFHSRVMRARRLAAAQQGVRVAA
jgi:MATE family multidrug resistance protein